MKIPEQILEARLQEEVRLYEEYDTLYEDSRVRL